MSSLIKFIECRLTYNCKKKDGVFLDLRPSVLLPIKNRKNRNKSKEERKGEGKLHIYCLHYIKCKLVVDCQNFSTMN